MAKILERRSVAVLALALALLVLTGVPLWLWKAGEATVAARTLRIPAARTDIAADGTLSAADYKTLLRRYNPSQPKTPTAPKKNAKSTPAKKGHPAPPPAIIHQPAHEDGQALVEPSSFGALPIIGPKGQRAWEAYRAPAPPQTKTGLAIIFVGAGLQGALLDKALGLLPAAVTFAFTPYAQNLDLQMEAVRKAGHEALMLIPMEPKEYPRHDPGARALMLKYEDAQNSDRLLWALGRGIGYTGIMPLFGDAFTETPWKIEAVLAMAAQRGVLFVDATTATGQEITASRAGVHGIPHLAVPENALDRRDSRSLKEALAKAVSAAKKQGNSAVVLPFLPISFTSVTEYAPVITAANVSLVAASAVAVIPDTKADAEEEAEESAEPKEKKAAH